MPAHILLLLAFAFTVMADPISSVAYAIEAALRGLGGNLALLLPTMALVIVVIAIVTVNYHQLVARFPDGGGSAAASGAAFGEAWSFLPIGALVVDFVLTIAISVAAGASAIVAYFPTLAPLRVLVALGLLVLVAGLTWFGHGGRTVFALLTLAFVGTGIALLVSGVLPVPHGGPAGLTQARPMSGWASWLSVALAFPVAMALATGVEAPSSAIAQLGQLNQQGRKRFGQMTLWRRLSVHHDPPAAVGSQFLLPGRSGLAQGSGPTACHGGREPGHPPQLDGTHQSPLYALLGRGALSAHRGSGGHCRRRPGPGVSALLCSRRLCELPDGFVGHGALLVCGSPPSFACRQCARHAGGWFYAGDESAARMVAALPGRGVRGRVGPVCPLGASWSPPRRRPGRWAGENRTVARSGFAGRGGRRLARFRAAPGC
ncbi:MAG: hypothetical protein ACJ8AG_19010 [Ktedonobacteraceae bacterium]